MKLSIANGRSVPEWVGATPDTPIPDRVKLRVWDRKQGRCHKCGRKIGPCEQRTFEHVIALINGGQNRESNLDLTCSWCLPVKNAEDVAIKSDVYQKRRKHILGNKSKSRPMPGSRDSQWKRRMDGTTERRMKP